MKNVQLKKKHTTNKQERSSKKEVIFQAPMSGTKKNATIADWPVAKKHIQADNDSGSRYVLHIGTCYD